ncbi:MAG: SPOR domain-containing protein [Candidatus Omnitrophica bacterium]|nr:SPOR domain-containing protein [Candidatus Omnitrophota bacterium]
MTFGNRESQLELFDVTHHAAPRPVSPHAVGRVFLHLRHDQLILTGMAGLIGLTVIFACGVERGKQLVRSERIVLARQGPSAEPSKSQGSKASSSATPTLSEEPGSASAGASAKPKTAPAPTGTPSKVKAPKRLAGSPAAAPKPSAGSASRYAVQVVTFSRLQLAKRELDRLRARGERAFLVMRDGRTMVYVGPFPSKTNATQKVTSLRTRYQDCFVRTL